MFYTSLFQSALIIWSHYECLTSQETNFFRTFYYAHSTCCPRLYSDASEHEPRWLSRHVTQLRQSKSTLICIFLESSEVALPNGYLTLKIRWAFEERIASQPVGVIFTGVLGLKLVTQLRNFERLYFRWITSKPHWICIFLECSKIALSFGTLTKIIWATF